MYVYGKRLILLITVFVCASGCGGKKSGSTSQTSSNTDGLPLEEYRIFVTSITTTGNLGGISGGDTICSNLASAEGLTRTYKAILSSTTEDAIDRLDLTHTGSVKMVRAGGTTVEVAPSISDLLSASPALSNPIDTDEQGSSGISAMVVTSSDTGGVKYSGACNDWTSSSNMIGDVANGLTTSTDGSWIRDDINSCATNFRLYCISQ